MRTFILRARQGSTRWQDWQKRIGGKTHAEIIAHCIMNAFFVANGFREDVVVHLILDSTPDFPRTIQLSGNNGLSFTGFHEEAILGVIENALKVGEHLEKNETCSVAPGLQISAFGFEKLLNPLVETAAVYLLDPKGEEIRTTALDSNPVFVLSDHLALPKNSIKGLKRRGLKALSVGRKMLFASQCVTILHYEMDRFERGLI